MNIIKKIKSQQKMVLSFKLAAKKDNADGDFKQIVKDILANSNDAKIFEYIANNTEDIYIKDLKSLENYFIKAWKDRNKDSYNKFLSKMHNRLKMYLKRINIKAISNYSSLQTSVFLTDEIKNCSVSPQPYFIYTPINYVAIFIPMFIGTLYADFKFLYPKAKNIDEFINTNTKRYFNFTLGNEQDTNNNQIENFIISKKITLKESINTINRFIKSFVKFTPK